MIGIPLGFLYANASEWLIHKYVLHGLGKNKANFFAFHWHEHHKKSRKNNMLDDQYEKSFSESSAKTKEALGIAALGLSHLPLLPVAPFFTLTVVACAANYYRVHRRAHLDPAWAEAHIPWHVDHHMAPNQHANWCVTHPLFDHLMGTREKYLGTPAHAAFLDRVAARAAANARQATPAVPSPVEGAAPSSSPPLAPLETPASALGLPDALPAA